MLAAESRAVGGAEPSSFGELLRRFRMVAGLTQEELAERAGLSGRGVQDLERGLRRSPYPDTTRRLAEALQLTPQDRARFRAAAEPRMRPRSASEPPGSRRRHNLPMPRTSFLGRDRERQVVTDRLQRARLVTLTGIGGCPPCLPLVRQIEA
jgi:transcriptional regulator with XRE-family HTH domain